MNDKTIKAVGLILSAALLTACNTPAESSSGAGASSAVSSDESHTDNAENTSASEESSVPADESHTDNAENTSASEESSVPADETTPEEDGHALAELRAELSENSRTFAAAYLGYYSAEDGAPLSGRIKENNERLLEDYPFIADIPSERMIGSEGYLFCIIPRGTNDSLAINRVHRSTENDGYETDEVAYRAESGEPVLVFCEPNGTVYEPDTSVSIVSEDGTVSGWLAALSQSGTISHENALDITDYNGTAPDPIEEYLAYNWLGPTEYGMTDGGTAMWQLRSSEAEYLLSFCSDGTVTLDWKYNGQAENEECWSGQWTVSEEIDRPTDVTISLSRVGGRNFDSVDAPMYISETYPVLKSPSGEEMRIFRGENGVLLPFMNDGELFSKLSLLY